MEKRVPSNAQIQTAGDTVLQGGLHGVLKSYVLNLANYKGIDTVTNFDMYPTSVKGLQKELLSADEYFRDGKFNVLLRQPDFEDGVSELYRPSKPRCGRNRSCHLPRDFAGSRKCATLVRDFFPAFGTLLVPPKATLTM